MECGWPWRGAVVPVYGGAAARSRCFQRFQHWPLLDGGGDIPCQRVHPGIRPAGAGRGVPPKRAANSARPSLYRLRQGSARAPPFALRSGKAYFFAIFASAAAGASRRAAVALRRRAVYLLLPVLGRHYLCGVQLIKLKPSTGGRRKDYSGGGRNEQRPGLLPASLQSQPTLVRPGPPRRLLGSARGRGLVRLVHGLSGVLVRCDAISRAPFRHRGTWVSRHAKGVVSAAARGSNVQTDLDSDAR